VRLIPAREPTPDQRLGRLEDPVGDFPFYNGAPTTISGPQWLLVLAATAVAFGLLIAPFNWPGGALGAWIPVLLFPAIPLAALAFVAPQSWRSIFGKVGWREVRLMIGFAFLNIVVTMSVGMLVNMFAEVSSNAAGSKLASQDLQGQLDMFARMAPQLFGEELITVLPFLALMHLFTHRFGAGRKKAIVAAWLISSLVFAMLHLPTYNWNWIQCIAIIGTARLVLTLPWILTKNIWVSTGAHITNDWLIFAFGLLGASLAVQS
jgi:membrane protease YdiL (CAAX protease family)